MTRRPADAGGSAGDATGAPGARHDAVRAGGTISAFVFWKVTPRLRVGRHPLTERDARELALLGITHVLDLREECEWAGPGLIGGEAIAALAALGVTRENVPIADWHAPREAELERAVGWIESVLAGRGQRLYVHCRAGIERTGTVVAAWRARTSGEPFGVALWSVRRHGWPARPLPHQQRAAEDWLERLRAGTAAPGPAR
jgi:rhodanese-related sulfurtransferase